MPELSIIVPAFNEEATIEATIERALAAELPVVDREVIVVENGSTDRTREVLRSRSWPPQVRIAELDRNRGKGGAVRLGAEKAEGRWMAILDADGEYDPNDLAAMLPMLQEQGMDAVLGTRAWQAHSAFSFWYVVGNRAINVVANVIYNVWLSDCMAGLKLMPIELFRELELREDGFAFEAEIVGRLLRHGARIYEVPITYQARTRSEGKKLFARHGWWLLFTFVRCRFT
ncbi:MAG: glycosyltransferase family 2 protein [Solirubrobacterales bacterium]